MYKIHGDDNDNDNDVPTQTQNPIARIYAI